MPIVLGNTLNHRIIKSILAATLKLKAIEHRYTYTSKIVILIMQHSLPRHVTHPISQSDGGFC